MLRVTGLNYGLLGLLWCGAGCQSERVAFQLLPSKAAQPASLVAPTGQPAASLPTRLIPSGDFQPTPKKVRQRPAASAARPEPQRRIMLPSRFANPSRQVLLAAQTQKVVYRQASQSTVAPAMNDSKASFWLAIAGLLLGVGGILLIYFFGGWVGISLGVLGILLGIYLGLWAGLLGEFPEPDSKPFRISKLFKLK